MKTCHLHLKYMCLNREKSAVRRSDAYHKIGQTRSHMVPKQLTKLKGNRYIRHHNDGVGHYNVVHCV